MPLVPPTVSDPPTKASIDTALAAICAFIDTTNASVTTNATNISTLTSGLGTTNTAVATRKEKHKAFLEALRDSLSRGSPDTTLNTALTNLLTALAP